MAKLSDVGHEITEPGTMVGTALYVSPEQVRGTNIDTRTDIYSLGIILYEMVTGQPPFKTANLNLLATLYKIEYEQPTPPSELNPNISPALEHVILQALHKEPRERFFDVQEMADALNAIPDISLQSHSFVLPSLPRAVAPIKLMRRYRYMLGTVLALCILMMIVLIGNSTYDQFHISILPLVPNSRGGIDDVIPTSLEIAQAQRWLGNQGFIAYVTCGLDTQSQASRAREMRDFAENYGVNYRVYNSALDSYKQLTLIEQARIEGARAIILCPLQPSILTDSLTSMDTVGIPYVLTDIIPETTGGIMLDEDNLDLGRLAGDSVAERFIKTGQTQPNVLILDYPDYSFSDERAQGFIDALTTRLPSAQIIARDPVAATRAQSQSSVADLISNGRDIDAVFSITDTGAYGTVTALDDAGIAPQTVMVASIGGESVALDYIFKDYYLAISVDVAREAGSHAALDALVKRLGGGDTPQIVNLPSGIVITRDIMEEQSASETN